MGRKDQAPIDAQPLGKIGEHRSRVGCGGSRRVSRGCVVGEELALLPQRHTIGAPDELERPARERLAGIPLPLRFQEHAPRGEIGEQSAGQAPGPAALVGPERRHVPLYAVVIVDRDVRRLAATGQPHVSGSEDAVDGATEPVDPLPGFRGERERRPWPLRHPIDAHHDIHRAHARLGQPCHRRRTGRIGCGREGEMPLRGEQATGRIEPDPAGAGEIGLGPGVKIGEVARRPRRTVERRLIGGELHQIAGAEPGRDPHRPQQRHKEPGRIAAAAGAAGKRLLWCLHPRFHPDPVADPLEHEPIEGHEDIDRPRWRGDESCLPCRANQAGEQVAADRRRQVRRELRRQHRIVGEGERLRLGIEEEIEGVDRHEIGDEIDRQGELARRLRKHDPRQVVALRILLPVEEVVARLDDERVAQDPGAAMGGRTEPDDMRREAHGPVEGIGRAMMEGDADRQGR